MGRYKRIYGSGNQLISDNIPTEPQDPPIITVATFADLPASPIDQQQVIVLDNGINGTPAGVLWVDALSKWILTITTCDFSSLPVGGIWSVSPPVESRDFTTFAFDQNNTNGATYDEIGLAWRQLADIAPVATFGDLPVGVINQQLVVNDNGFGELAYVVHNGSDWIVLFTTVPLTANLPVDGVWNLSPSVISEAGTLTSSNESNSYWIWSGLVWFELNPVPTDFVSETIYADLAALEMAFPAASNGGKYGLASVASMGGITTIYISDATNWLTQISAGSVATFSELTANVFPGTTFSVTGEAGLTDCIITHLTDGNYVMTQVTCAYSVYSAIEWGATPGEWYNAGGITVVTDLNCKLVDETNNEIFVWDSTHSIFVPEVVFSGAIAGIQKIKGDSATPSGWTPTDTDGGGTASITTDGSKITLSTSTAAASATSAVLTYTDASLSSAGNWYFRGMVQSTTLSGRNAAWRVAVYDGTDVYDFGSARNIGAATATGQWYNPSTSNAAYTAQSGEQLDLTSAEVLLEIMKIGSRCMARVAGGLWVDVTGTTVRNSALTQVLIVATLNPDTTIQSDAVVTVRHVASMRF